MARNCSSTGAVAVGGESPAHQHQGSVADETGDDRVRKRGEAHVGERGIHAVAKVLRRIDQCAIEVEDQQLERFDREGAEDADHGYSLQGLGVGVRGQRAGNREQRIGNCAS